MLHAMALAATLVLNEVLYDPAGADAGREFVEILNVSDAGVPLAGLAIEAGDGARPGAWRTAWQGASGEIAPGGLLLVAGDSLRSAQRLAGELQNGPDALRLRRGDAVLDLLGYGALTDPRLFETRPATDVSGTSLARRPDGYDTDDNAADFFPASPSPGRRNLLRRNLALALAPPDPTQAWPGRRLRATASVRNTGLESAAAESWSARAELQGPWAEAPDDSARVRASWPVELGGSSVAIAAGDSAEFVVEWIGSTGVFRLEASVRSADEDTTDDGASAWVRVGAGGVVVNEIQFEPASGAAEWIELWNRDTRDQDLRGWTLADRSGRRGRLVAAREIPAGGFALASADTSAPIPGLDPAALRVAVLPWHSLNNSDGEDGFADELVLRDAADRVVDALRYSAAWGGERGRSLERLLPDPDVRGLLWAPSKSPDGATPGRRNSATAPPGAGAQVGLSPNPFTPDGDGRDDLLTAVLDVPVGFEGFRARVFDLEGRCRARLGSDRLGPGPRHLAWEGRDEGGTPLPTGIYILDVELNSKSRPALHVRRVIGLSRR